MGAGRLLVEDDAGKAAAAVNPLRRIRAHPADGLDDFPMTAEQVLIPYRFVMSNTIAKL